MNPTLLKDLILAGHRVACKTNEWDWRVFLFIDWEWYFQWTLETKSIEECLSYWLNHSSYTEDEYKKQFTWEYKIVTPLPQLPQVWDTVEVLEICTETYLFDTWDDRRVNMIWKKYTVENTCQDWTVTMNRECFSSRMVAKCEPDVEPTPVSEEKTFKTITIDWKNYELREII
jgi:hypothetical protein